MTARRLPMLLMLVVIETACGGVVKPPPCGSGPLRWRPIAEPIKNPVALWTHEGIASAPERYWKQNAVIIWGTSTETASSKGMGAVLLLPDDWE
jgi:hypothetical protein